MKELTLKATLGTLEEVLAFVGEQLDNNNCSNKIKMQIEIAVEEIYINICNYAYNPKVGFATIRVEVDGNPLQATITFIDNGVAYDPLKKPDPDTTLSADERDIGGLGIYMVKKSMDAMDYTYEDGKNILTMKKKLIAG